MKSHAHILLLALALSLSVAGDASGQGESNDPVAADSGLARIGGARSAPGLARPVRREAQSDAAVPAACITEHAVLVNGHTLRYRATAGYMPIRRDSGSLLANIFFVAYEQENTERKTRSGTASNPQSEIITHVTPGFDRGPQSKDRPITFAFNGGPGASSVWLHMGAFGPKRALLANDGTALPRSNSLVDNEYTWLAFTDLVFVDPVGTGFSFPAAGNDADQFYEVQMDMEVAADFVRLFVTQHERWLSPQFLVGESYGTTRAVSMARHLQDRYGLYVNGLILLSSALDMGAISLDPGNDLPYVLSLPSCTAVALYHGKLGERPSLDLERSLQRVQAWALSDYLAALAKGRLLSQAGSRQIARRLAEYTGLDEEMIARSRLRISTLAFAQELLGREGRVLGLLDGRVAAPNVPSPRRAWTDPSLFLVEGPFVAAFNSYVRDQLGFRTDRPYVFLSEKANASWNWGPSRRGYLNVAPTLAEAMSLDNRLRVFAAAGYYDLTTPYLSQEYVFNHLDLPDTLQQNVTFRHYYTGHQIYTSTDALRRLTEDVKAFMAGPEAQ